MKLGFTINIGNYENVRFDSNDFPTLKECILDIVAQVKKELDLLSHVALCVQEFITRNFGDEWF